MEFMLFQDYNKSDQSLVVGKSLTKLSKSQVILMKCVGIKSLLDAVWITAAHIYVNAAQLELVLLRDFKENMLTEVNAASENMLEVTTASEYQVNAARSNILYRLKAYYTKVYRSYKLYQSHGALDLGSTSLGNMISMKNEGTARRYCSKVLNAHIRYHLKELRYCAQCLIIENEDFVKRLRDHYIEPTEFEIQEMMTPIGYTKREEDSMILQAIIMLVDRIHRKNPLIKDSIEDCFIHGDCFVISNRGRLLGSEI
ncbi:hypothetical protein Tco_0641507 [Tanacetum coccineum]